MITVDQTEREERRKLLNKATKHFEKFNSNYLCIGGEVKEGELMAIRPMSESGCIIIFRIAHDDVELYLNVIKIEEA